ncbi:uncharacterized protein LOC128680466 [Plodia interpunctella]|uniref:uncharacterized protein LOC128680466 n=1 Tax=Plodia interpunctella TaxID=58824 RepID=UPI002367B3C5|nr:uncharacterized protein LOC128680466 [Plodia interpunctella]
MLTRTLCLLGAFVSLSHMGLFPWPVSAQYMYDPNLYFEKMKFDMEVRGSYNIAECVSDHMNCWEVVKPDLICSYKEHYASVCDVLREYCHDLIGDQPNYWYAMQVQEMWCNDWEAFTK